MAACKWCGGGVQGEATGRAIKLARLTKTPLYVVHVMSKDAAEEIVKGRATGQKVWGEVVAGAIGLTDQKWSVPSPLATAAYTGQHATINGMWPLDFRTLHF